MDFPCYSPEERESAKAKQMQEQRERIRLWNIRDESGISRAMVDKMIAIWAESLNTGGDNIRDLMYCAYREARKIERQYEEREAMR